MAGKMPARARRTPLHMILPRHLSESACQDIRNAYVQDARPWVIGFSGGKDSTCVLQLVCRALSALKPAMRKKPIFVISSNTLVESPAVVEYIRTSLSAIEAYGRAA